MDSGFSLIEGVVAALGTPLDDRENLHVEGMCLQIRMQQRSGVDALLLLGSMGTMQLLRDQTFMEALAVAVEEANGKIPIVVGCGDTSTERTLTRIRWAEQFPVAGIAVVPPYFFRFTQRELLHHFTELASSTRMPIYLHDNPAWTKHNLDLDLITELSKLPNIVGLKGSGELVTLRQCIEYFKPGENFRVLAGQTHFFDLALQLGADGIVDGLFAIASELGVQLRSNVRKGQFTQAQAVQRKISRLASIPSLGLYRGNES